jgi:NAD+ synthase (glutamine-hydrolysing)
MRQWSVLPQPLSGHRLILNISASPFWHGKLEVRQRMLGALAKRHGATLVMVNQVGANDSLIFDGGSFAVGPGGEVFAQGCSFAEDLVVLPAGSALRVPGMRWCWARGTIWASAASSRRLWG